MTSRQRIIDAAILVFARKGRFGAHMEDIAALAHINKAMIYYIFHSKDELYLEVLKQVFSEISLSFSSDITVEPDSSDSCADAILMFISGQISFFIEHRNYTKIMVDAMSSSAEEIPLAIKYYKENHSESDPSARLRKVIENGKRDKYIRDVDTEQLIISIIGMVIIYFFSQSMTMALDIEVQDEQKFLKERKESIIDLVLNGILIKDTKKSTLKKK